MQFARRCAQLRIARRVAKMGQLIRSNARAGLKGGLAKMKGNDICMEYEDTLTARTKTLHVTGKRLSRAIWLSFKKEWDVACVCV